MIGYVRAALIGGSVGVAGSLAFGWWSVFVTAPLAAAIGISLGRDATRVRRAAEPPRGAKIVRATGEVVPLELIYVGRVDGTHVWEVVTAAAYRPFSGDRLTIDVLPAHTMIRFTTTPDGRQDHEG